MIICFNATSEAKKALDELMATAQFKDVSQAICMALENYQILQLTIPHGGGVMAAASVDTKAKGMIAPPASPLSKDSIHAESLPLYPTLFASKNGTVDSLKLASIPKSKVTSGNVSPLHWLFGQYNKFLPVKATCRALLNLSYDSPSGVPVEDATSKIADAACGLGDYLKALDSKHDLRREDALAAAFPSSDIKGGGSRLRFGNQFVANVRQRQLEGFPAALRLVALGESKEARVLLTTAGADFAALENPILEGGGKPPLQKLSDAEAAFLVSHVSKNVPEEASAYVAIIDAIAKGANTPDGIDKFLCQMFNIKISINAQSEHQITQTFLATQRTGAISRMVDLRLISREKNGLRVTYLITKNGDFFRSQSR